MPDFHVPIFPGGLYHVLNRGNGDERIFRNEENYRFFLQRYRHYISPIAETLAWCLLPNHYHFLIRVKLNKEITSIYERQKGASALHESVFPAFIMQQFSNWQNSYAKAFNKMFDRKGSLFMDYMRRVEINKDLQMGNSVFYIHKNPVHHGIVKAIDEWKWSSFNEYSLGQFSLVDSKEVIEWFGTQEEFLRFHQRPIEIK